MVTASVSGKRAATEALLEEARVEEARLREEWSAARGRVAVLERELRRLEDLERGAQTVSLEAVRDVVMKFRGGFTDGELAAELGVPARTVKPHLKTLLEDGAISDTGELFNRKVIYEYVQPAEAGAGFEAQQRLAPQEPSPPGGTSIPVKIVHAPRGIHKDIRRVVKQAMQDGWTCAQDGSGHYVLTRGKQKIGFASTPRNPTNEAVHLKRNLARAERIG